MDVFDSSVWLWGLLTDDTLPSRLVEEVKDGSRSVAVSAYIHDEVTRTLQQAESPSEPQMVFNNTVADLDNVLFPDQADIRQTVASEVQARPAMRVLGTVLGIQAKDAPVLVFAADLNGETTLHVADSGFTLVPEDHNLTNLHIENIAVDA